MLEAPAEADLQVRHDDAQVLDVLQRYAPDPAPPPLRDCCILDRNSLIAILVGVAALVYLAVATKESPIVRAHTPARQQATCTGTLAPLPDIPDTFHDHMHAAELCLQRITGPSARCPIKRFRKAPNSYNQCSMHV